MHGTPIEGGLCGGGEATYGPGRCMAHLSKVAFAVAGKLRMGLGVAHLFYGSGIAQTNKIN
jgi:hypothetical protein